jgi:hypothetical protein
VAECFKGGGGSWWWWGSLSEKLGVVCFTGWGGGGLVRGLDVVEISLVVGGIKRRWD